MKLFSKKVASKTLLLIFKKVLRNSRTEVFCKKGVLKNFAKFTGKHLCQSFFFKDNYFVEHRRVTVSLF